MVHGHYKKLAFEMAAHFLIMYAVMYTMVDKVSDVRLNINNLYMTGMMVLPMAAIMILSMRSMFPNKKLNVALISASLAAFALLYSFERKQTFVGDVQFIHSMIPHHSGAILMCDEAAISDPQLKSLCRRISTSQREEIDEMKVILNRLKGRSGLDSRSVGL